MEDDELREGLAAAVEEAALCLWWWRCSLCLLEDVLLFDWPLKESLPLLLPLRSLPSLALRCLLWSLLLLLLVVSLSLFRCWRRV